MHIPYGKRKKDNIERNIRIEGYDVERKNGKEVEKVEMKIKEEKIEVSKMIRIGKDQSKERVWWKERKKWANSVKKGKRI